MSKEYRRLIKRQARITELLEQKEHNLTELKNDIEILRSESKSIHADIFTMHLAGDSETKND